MNKKQIINKLKLFKQYIRPSKRKFYNNHFFLLNKKGTKSMVKLQKMLIDLNPTEKEFKDGFGGLPFTSDIVWYLNFRKNK